MKCMSKKKKKKRFYHVTRGNATTLSKGDRRDWKTQFAKRPYTGPAYFHSRLKEIFIWHWKKRCLDSFTPLGQIRFFFCIHKEEQSSSICLAKVGGWVGSWVSLPLWPQGELADTETRYVNHQNRSEQFVSWVSALTPRCLPSRIHILPLRQNKKGWWSSAVWAPDMWAGGHWGGEVCRPKNAVSLGEEDRRGKSIFSSDSQ